MIALLSVDPGTGVGLFGPLMELGFAGFCAALLYLLFWLVRKFLIIFAETKDVVAKNTQVIERLSHTTSEQHRILTEMHDLLLARPCILEGREKHSTSR